MRKQEIEKTENEIEIIYCDKCGEKQTGHNYSVCSICERDLCKKCFGKPRVVDDYLFIMPCPFCWTLKNGFVEKIKGLFLRSEEYRNKAFDVQRDWGKESLKLK